MTDMQNIYLTQISYLDFDWNAMKCDNKQRLSEVECYLLHPDFPFCGPANATLEKFISAARKHLSGHDMWTDKQLYDHIISSGLGDLTIIDIASDKKSGFQATAFIDENDNVGISYRGSDFDLGNGGLQDWIEADFFEYFTNDSPQRLLAIEFFQKHAFHKNVYIYGHSLGGNLSSHVYAIYNQLISSVFILNGYPINPKLLHTQDRIDAFNADKYRYYCICGDAVSHIKSHGPYKNNVRYLKYNDEVPLSPFSAHLAQSITYDNQSFVYENQDNIDIIMNSKSYEWLQFSQKMLEGINQAENQIAIRKEINEEKLDLLKEKIAESGLNQTIKSIFKK